MTDAPRDATGRSPMRIVIVGAGAVGGYFGARLPAKLDDVPLDPEPSPGVLELREISASRGPVHFVPAAQS